MIRVNSGFWKDSGFILARIECDFIAQIHHPAQVKFGFRIRRIGRSSMNTEGGLFVDGHIAAVTLGVLVWFGYRTHRPEPVPASERHFTRPRHKLAPEARVATISTVLPVHSHPPQGQTPP